MEPREAVAALSVEDRLSLEIGRVARRHVELDWQLRGTFLALTAPSYATPAPLTTQALIDGCRVEIAAALPPDHPVRVASGPALAAAESVNGERNRVVHDEWMRARDKDGTPLELPRWNRQRTLRKSLFGEVTPVSLDDATGVTARLSRVRLRVFAVHWALLAVLPFYEGFGASDLPAWIDVMEDRFDDLPNGAFRAHSDPVP